MSATEEQTPQRVRHWILSSSGAQPLFLENIVRALALPAGETIRFRYEQGIVSQRFRDLVAAAPAGEPSQVVGNTAYLSYLDNRDTGTPPKVYPVREAEILAVTVLGTSYIIDMRLQCFIDWSVDSRLDETIAKLALDSLPAWPSSEEERATGIGYVGHWVAATQPLDGALFRSYSATSRTHLKAFESTAETLSRTADFRDGKRLFATIVRLRDAKTDDLVSQSELSAGHLYDLHVYHYQPGDGTHKPVNDFRLEATSDSPDVSVVGAAEKLIEARYDEVVFSFRVSDDARDERANLGLNVKRFDPGVDDPVYILRSALHCTVHSAVARKLLFGVIIGVGLFGTQAVTLFATGKQSTTTVALALAFSILAGMGSAFQFRTKV